MKPTLSRTAAAEDVSERDAAWFEELAAGVARGRAGLLARQQPDGHWVGELEGDTILESEFVLLLAFLGKLDDPRIRPAANYLLNRQQPGGGWANYTGGPAEISASVKAYFALKIAGHAANEPHMTRAADVIRALGGAEATNSFTRFYLALLGQVPYSACPSVPAEIILLPRWFYFNVYAMSAWSRTIFVPLSVVDAHKPVTRLPDAMSVRELFLAPPETPRWPAKPTKQWFSWTNVFLGVPDDDAEMRWVLKQIDDLCIYEDDTLRLQPCVSPVWDTALSLIGAADAGLPGRAPECEAAVRWLLEKEVRRAGDWSKTVRGVEPGGWFFEYRNGFYPDTDDTSMVLIALARSGHAMRGACAGPVHRAINWLLAMQNRDGGWAAFDKDIDKRILERVPFADHNAMLDPSCPDITARVLEALGHYGFRVGQPPVDAAVRFILNRQEESGAWFGRCGVNYIYGTWQVLVGLHAIGFDVTAPVVRRAVRWLKEAQNEDGGWGESCKSYDDPATAGQGESTASQTAWALLGLLAAGEGDGAEMRAGAEFLIGTQHADGGWTERPFTGTGFLGVGYLKCHMYPVYFPLMALGRYLKTVGPRPSGSGKTARTHPGHTVGGPRAIDLDILADS